VSECVCERERKRERENERERKRERERERESERERERERFPVSLLVAAWHRVKMPSWVVARKEPPLAPPKISEMRQ